MWNIMRILFSTIKVHVICTHECHTRANDMSRKWGRTCVRRKAHARASARTRERTVRIIMRAFCYLGY